MKNNNIFLKLLIIAEIETKIKLIVVLIVPKSEYKK